MYTKVFIDTSISKDTMDEHCTVYQTMEILSKKWTLLILLELYKSPTNTKRYSELKTNFPTITPKILSTRLKELEHNNLITKHIDTSHFPVKCEYQLTKSGKDVIPIIKNIKSWALRWNIKNKTCANQDCKECDI